MKSFFLISVLNPGIELSLSIVPPVCPKPFPDIFNTLTSKEANKGTNTREVLSPTPPVECLSTVIPFIFDVSRVSPLSIIAFVCLHYVCSKALKLMS